MCDPTILIIIFWNFIIFKYRSDSPQVKRNFILSIAKLPHELPNDLRLRILGNWEIFKKSQIRVETKPIAHFLFKKCDFDNSSEKWLTNLSVSAPCQKSAWQKGAGTEERNKKERRSKGCNSKKLSAEKCLMKLNW